MIIRFSRTFTLFFLFLLAASTAVLAQQNPVVHFNGAKMRAPLELSKGTSMVRICGLEPGNTYALVATGAAYGQRADFEIAPAPALTKGASNFAYMRERKNAVRFAAPTSCVDIQVNTLSREQGDRAPMYLSIKCESCPEANDWLKKVTGQPDFATIQVEEGFSAEELIKDVLVGGGCFQVSDVNFSGQGSQIGKFSSGITNIGFDEGLIIATGNIQVATGPNDSDGASQGFGIATPDFDLQTLTIGNTFDMANIEFDFVPTQSQVVFEYVFASEEYCEYVNSQFNDVFGFFISGPGITGTQNIALIPSTNTPVAINNVNHQVNSGLYTHNTPLFGMNCGVLPAFGPAVQELQYDGFTKKFVAIANVVPCQKYHIKLKIADVGDGVWDSAVFLRANSFDAGGEVLATPAYPGSFGSAYESCDAGGILFKRGNSNANQPLVVNFAVAGTATPGVDYVPITSPVIIPAGQTELFVPVQVIPDIITEGSESIVLVIPNACTCTQGQVEFLIKDRPLLQASLAGQELCEGEVATLQASVSGGFPDASLNYQWSTGETTETISPTTTGTFSLTVTDGCSIPAVATAQVVFNACGCASETFIQAFGQDGQHVRGYGIYDSQDGNLYITGLKQDSALIIKMTPAGTVLWMRSFDVQNGVNDNISELIVDSEGMLVGCGQSGDVQPNVSGFVFRYNPVTNNMQWVNTFSNESPYVMGLVELPNGNYLLYDNPHQPTNDNRMLEITQADGTIDLSSPLSQQLNLGGGDNFNSAVIHNGKLYGVGRYTNGADFVNMRHALSRINLGSGAVEWSRLSHVAPDAAARLYGMDLLIEDNNIISVSFGSETDDNLNNSRIFLQKTGLGGNLIWSKRFDLLETSDEAVEEIVSVPDGFILYARGSSVPSDLYLIKTDKDGVYKWAKKVDYGFNDYVGSVSTFQSQILVKGSHLFFMASSEGPANSQMLVAKTTLDGTVEGNCDFIEPTAVNATEVVDPVNFPVVLQQVPFNEEVSTLVRTPQNTAMSQVNQCKVYVNQVFDIVLCPGKTFNLDGIVYAQDTTFSITIPGNGGCDTLRTYAIGTLPYPTREEQISLCQGGSITIGGVVYNQSGTVVDTLPSLTDCDTIVTYIITVQPEITRDENLSFCPGESVTLGGQVYTQSGVVVLTASGLNNACDTVVTYTLTQLPYQTNNQIAQFCAGQSVNIDGVLYNQPGIVVDTVPTATGCDIIVTYTLVQLPYQTRSESISFCPGESVTIDGQVYNQTGTVVDTIHALSGAGCDTIVTYTLTLLPQPTRAETIVFCPGETVTLGGNSYTQPGNVVLTLPSTTGGCDTIATYTLQFATPAPSNVSITCPGAITIGQPSGTSGAVVNFGLPTASSDCPCPGIDLSMTSGLPSGSLFPSGTTSVCYAAKDSCGQTASCCFKVTIQEDDPCDVKVNGCIKYELLTITEDAGKNRTYRIRVTNNCTNKLIYTAIQQPDGMVAIEPANFATYTAPSGNTYRVRNPNFTPQYSIRYSSLADSINNGESDIFKYTLPAQTNAVTFIHVVSRLAPYIYLGAHLNTFYCPIGVTPTDDRLVNEERDLTGMFELGVESELLLFPNPTSGDLYADFSPWQGARLNVQVLDSRGQRVTQWNMTAAEEAQAIDLPAELPNGLYFLEMLTEGGARYRGRFVVQR